MTALKWNLSTVSELKPDLRCFITGKAPPRGHHMPNIFGRVESKEEGEQMVEAFDGFATLAPFHDHSDLYYVAVGALEEHKSALPILRTLVRYHDNIADPYIFATARALYLVTCQNILARGSKDDASELRASSERWETRGIGSEGNLSCFVAQGDKQELLPNISGFVGSREAGERVVRMFDGFARLDYRPHEPTHIQVKVGALKENEGALRLLEALVYVNDGFINPGLVEMARRPYLAIRPDRAPGATKKPVVQPA